MFAVIKTGGKQYKVSPGTLLKVERLDGDAGQSIHLSSVLLLNQEGTITVGAPLLSQVQVSATIVEQTRADKIIVFKKKRRQGYRRKAGHRQDITVLRIEEILTDGKKLSSIASEAKDSSKSIDGDGSLDISASEVKKIPAIKKSKATQESNLSAIDLKNTAETTTHEIMPVESTTAELISTKPVKKSVKKSSTETSELAETKTQKTVPKEKKKLPSSSLDLDPSKSS